jgi:phosphopantothenoylcysteine decarboxylase/phosphopantothenate--cysteine ligase
MGYALANEFSKRGAFVELVSGPVNIKVNSKNINITKVTSAAEMYNACTTVFAKVNIAIMAAAVADYTPENTQKQKIKKQSGELTIKLKKTKDILNDLGNNKRTDQYLVGFALETENEIENAKAKLKNKKLDLIVLNSLQDKGAGFGHATNKITLLDKKGSIEKFKLKSKSEVAKDIADKISKAYKMKN